MTVETVSVHRLAFPPKDWEGLCLLAPNLRLVDRVAQMLDMSRYPLTYLALRDIASLVVGWSRASVATGLCACGNADSEWPHSLFNMADLDAMHEPKPVPSNEVEAWLRTSAAYDVALRHVIEITG